MDEWKSVNKKIHYSGIVVSYQRSCHVAASERTQDYPSLHGWSTVCVSHHFHNALITEVVMVMNNRQYALCKLVADIDNLARTDTACCKVLCLYNACTLTCSLQLVYSNFMAISKSLEPQFTQTCVTAQHMRMLAYQTITVDVEAVIHIAKDSNGLGIYMGQAHVSSINNYLNSALSQ